MDEDRVLVIGYGSEILGDDGAGRRVADLVEQCAFEGVDVISVHELTPELSEPISHARLTLLVDACEMAAGSKPAVVRLERSHGTGSAMAHAMDPADLLDLAHSLYGKCPEAWLIAVPAFDFRLGEALSDATQIAVAEAVDLVRSFAINGAPSYA